MSTTVAGQLVLEDRVASGSITIDDGRIATVTLEEAAADGGPYIAPGFVDVHVHGWGGHDAMGDSTALDGMARALLRRGVTSFLPTAVTAPLDDLAAFAERVDVAVVDDAAHPPLIRRTRGRRRRHATERSATRYVEPASNSPCAPAKVGWTVSNTSSQRFAGW